MLSALSKMFVTESFQAVCAFMADSCVLSPLCVWYCDCLQALYSLFMSHFMSLFPVGVFV